MLYRLAVLPLLCWAFVPPSEARAQTQGTPLNCKTPAQIEGLLPGTSFGANDSGKLVGKIQIICDDTSVFADEITWDAKIMRARGNVLVVQQGLRVTADHLEMDRVTKLGTFYKAAGTARLTDKAVEPSQFGTLEPEVSFHAEKVEKLGPRKYRLTDGWFSTCVQANPRWDIRGSSGTITLDEHVLLRNALLRVKGVPVVYLPMLYYPLGEDDRSTGFLIPTYSTSSVKGQGFSNAFFWAIDRSQDATFYHDWFSKSGQGAGTEYRFVSSPGSRGNAKVYMMDEKERRAADGTLERSAHRSYEVSGTMNQALGRYFRAIARTRYFTDVSTLQLYQQNSFEAAQRTRYFSGSVTGNIGRYRIFGIAEQRDFYTGLSTAQRAGRLPQVSLTMGDRPLGRSRIASKISLSANAEVAGIRNQADISQSSTNRSLWRFDASPTIRAPLSSLPFLSATVSGSWRITHWTDSLDPATGVPESVSITRPLTEIKADVTGPIVARVFQTPNNGYADKFKHTIEPRVSVQWLSPFDHVNNIINNDYSVDCLVGGNTTVAYSLFNRIWARKRQAGGSSRAKEIFWTSISQSYYTQAGASACDIQYQTTSVGQFSAIQINASASPTESMSGRFQMFIDSKTRQVQSYSGSVTALGRLAQLTAVWTKRQYLPNVPGFDNPVSASHQIFGSGTLRSPGGRLSGGFGVRLDVRQKQFLEQRVSASYSAQCCGISVDYQVLDLTHLGALGRTDHRFNFSFTLAGIGSFSNPLGSFGR